MENVTWLNDDEYIDEVGGHHDSGIGWNPLGHWCGECTRASCKDCVNEWVYDDTDINNLKPCPCCGGKAEFKCDLHIEPVIDESGAYSDADFYYWEYVRCTECGLEVRSDNEDDEHEGITILKWNRRISNA